MPPVLINRHFVLFLCIATASVLSGCGERNTYQPPPPAEVGVQKPESRKVTIYREFTGTTQAFAKVDLVARVQGVLQKREYTDGERVKKGQVLFRIERDTYEASLQSAEAAVAQQEALLRQADADLARQRELSEKQVASKATFEDSRGRRDSTAAALDQAKVQVQQAKINLGYTEVTAPFDGIVSARLVDVGALVGANGPTKLATIYQDEPMYVSFNITEQQAIFARQRIGVPHATLKDLQLIPVEVGLQTEKNFPQTGHVDYVSPDLDAATGTLTVRAVLDNKAGILVPGLFVRVRVPVFKDVEALLVPDRAFGNDQQGRYLLIVDDNDIVAQRTVETGELIDGGLRIVTAGLKSNDRVIVSGIQRATPGAKVRPVQADASIADPSRKGRQ